MSLKRIVIVGVTGSGKTTLGKNISEALGTSAVDLDEIHWLPGWQSRDIEEARRMVDTATQGQSWVISGNYRKLQDIFWPRADTMIWLDYPFLLVFWRLLKRSVCRMLDKKLICNGNTETWQNFFSRKSIMVWLFQSFGRRKRELGQLFTHPELNPHLTFLRFIHPDETEAWLKSL